MEDKNRHFIVRCESLPASAVHLRREDAEICLLVTSLDKSSVHCYTWRYVHEGVYLVAATSFHARSLYCSCCLPQGSPEGAFQGAELSCRIFHVPMSNGPVIGGHTSAHSALSGSSRNLCPPATIDCC